jgi:hypothetical protein
MTNLDATDLITVTGGNLGGVALKPSFPNELERWGVPWTGPRIQPPRTGPDPTHQIGVPARVPPWHLGDK